LDPRGTSTPVFKSGYVRPGTVADGLAELQVHWPDVSIVFCDTRPPAEQWTYRYLAAARRWAADADSVPGGTPITGDAPAPGHTTAGVRRWARQRVSTCRHGDG
jgi:hypothetical protein